MSVYDRVHSILSYGETLAINFVCQGVPVNPALFARVRGHLNNPASPSPVSVIVNSRYLSPGQITGGFIPLGTASSVAAEYDPDGNAFLLSSESLGSIFEESTVVHEAVHCGFDLDRRRNWPWFGQEANAYIAGARFALNKGVPVDIMRGWSSLHGVAAAVAAQLGRPGQEVTWEQYLPLRQAILSCPTYRGYGPSYCYNNNG
jgi:hypothetical protein